MFERWKSLKIDYQGIRFKTWALFVLFAGGILVLLWFLQLSFLRPYYRSVKVDSVQRIAEQITASVETNYDFAQEITDLTYNNDMCLSFYDYEEFELLNVNALGMGCYFNTNSYTDHFNIEAYIERINGSEAGEVYDYVTSERFKDEMLVYGKKIESHLGRYYLLINSTIEPIDSTVFIMQNQFLIVSVSVLLIAGAISFWLAKIYSVPISKMTNSAALLAQGNYDVEFENGSYTEINGLAKTLNYATKELSKMDELRRDLIANVSHDIKTPLTTIKAYAEMINDISGNNPVKRREHIDVIINETNHLNNLVDDMMVLTKVQSGNMTLKEVRFDLVKKTQEIIGVLQGIAMSMGIDIILEAPKRAAVIGDVTMIGQIIYNFLNNAVKHVGSDNKVFVRIQDWNEKYKVSITDHGAGIKEEDLPYIWDRYYKIDKNFKRNQEGSGLGLSISKAYLDLHGCSYGVNTQAGEGTTFWFII